MIPSIFRSALVLSLALFVLSCGGSDGGGSNPGPTGPTGFKADITLGAAQVDLGFPQEATLTFDGREINRMTWATICGACLLSGSVANASAGEHTVVYTVVRQSRASVPYGTAGAVVLTNLATGAVRQIDLPLRNVTLRAGESVTYRVSF